MLGTSRLLMLGDTCWRNIITVASFVIVIGEILQLDYPFYKYIIEMEMLLMQKKRTSRYYALIIML